MCLREGLNKILISLGEIVQQYIIGSKSLANIAENNFLLREMLLYTKGQYMKESNTLAAYVTIKQLQRDIWLNTEGLYMKELNTLAGNAGNNFP